MHCGRGAAHLCNGGPGVVAETILESGGLAFDGEFVRFRSCRWKGNERTRPSCRLWIIDFDDHPALDPEAKLAVDNLREVEFDG